MTWRDIKKKIEKGKELSQEDKDWVLKKTDAYWEQHPDVTARFPRWKKILAWVCGYQYHDFNTVNGKLMPVPIDRKRKLVFNRMRSFVRTMHSKLCADVPQPNVVPKTSEDADIEASRMGNKVIEGLSDKLQFSRLQSIAKLWMVLLNRVCVRVFWNMDDYGIIDYIREERTDPETGETSEKVIEAREPGDVAMEVINPFNFRTDPLYFERSKWRWFLYGDYVDAEELEAQYDLEDGELKETSNALDSAFNLVASDDGETSIMVADRQDDVAGRVVLYKELWTKDFYIFTAGKKVLEYGPNVDEEIPFYVTEDRTIPINAYDKEIIYNDSLLKDVIPVQREFNRWKSLMSLALERATKFKVMLPLNSVLTKKQFTDDLGLFIDYNPKLGEPHQLRLDPLPSFLPQYSADLEREFETVINIHEASFGRLPERASHASGTLVNLLLEQDDAVLNPMLTAINEMFSQAWSLALRKVRDNYDPGRLLKFTGEDGAVAVKKFRGADLQGNTDVQVTSQTGLPRSRALRIEYIMKLREAGLLTDDKNTLEMLEFGDAERVFSDSLVHERRAHRENAMIAENPMINPQEVMGWVYPLEDHAAHIKIHMKERLSIKVEKYQPNQTQALDALIQTHYQQMQQLMMQQQQQMAAAKAPPQGPPPQGGQGQAPPQA
jgi:hypothetical protein